MKSSQTNKTDDAKPSSGEKSGGKEAAATVSESERIKAEKLRKAREEVEKLRRERGRRPAPVDEAKDETADDLPLPPSPTADAGGDPAPRTRTRQPSKRSSSNGANPENPKARLKKRHILNQWPVLVWGVALVFALIVHFGFVKETPASGEVEKATHVLPATETAIVSSLAVTRWERVELGQEILVLSCRKLQETLAELDARLAMRLLDLRTGNQDRITELGIRLEERTIELEALEKERKILSDQVTSMNSMLAAEAGNPLVARFLQQGDFAKELADASSDLIQVESKIAKETIATARDKAALAAAEAESQRLQSAEAIAVATAEEARERIHLQEQLEALVVRSPVSGYVSFLHHSLGERVEDGEPLLEIVEDPRWIRVGVPSDRSGALKAGSLLWIQRIDDPTRVYESPVLKLAPLILEPENRPRDRVQEVFVACPENAGFIPGQEVRAYLDNPGDPRFVVFGREFRRSFTELSGQR